MHGRYQQRIQHAERNLISDPQLRARDERRRGSDHPYDDGGGFTLSGPVTITIRTTLSVSLSATPTSSWSSTGVATSSSTPAPVQSSSSKTESLSQTPSSSFTLLPSASILPPSSTSSPLPTVPPGNSTIPQGINGLSFPSLSSGGIAGIVIACLILLFLGLFFGLRKRFQRNRLRLRGIWTRTRAIGDPTLMAENSYEPKSHSSMTFRRSDPTSNPQFSQFLARNPYVSLPPPPISYNNHDEGTTSPYAGISTPPATISSLSLNGGGNTATFNAPTYSPSLAGLSPFAGAVVMCSFITSLPDELPIKVGETIHVLTEYDDGWALCVNANGQQGMVPMECLNGGRIAAPTMSDVNFSTSRLPDVRGIRRASSLARVRP